MTNKCIYKLPNKLRMLSALLTKLLKEDNTVQSYKEFFLCVKHTPY